MSNGSEALNKALGDPSVERLAAALQLDLQDPTTIAALLSMTQRYVDMSTEFAPAQKQFFAQALTPGQSRHARDAIHTYQEIAAMH